MADDIQILAPLRSARPAFDWRNKLDGITYQFVFRYNTRNKRYALDFRSADGTDLQLGIALVEGVSLLEVRRGFAGFPPGQLFIVNTEGKGTNPGRNDFRGRSQLKYRALADVERLAGTAEELF